MITLNPQWQYTASLSPQTSLTLYTSPPSELIPICPGLLWSAHNCRIHLQTIGGPDGNGLSMRLTTTLSQCRMKTLTHVRLVSSRLHTRRLRLTHNQFPHESYLKSDDWKCQESPSGAHHWVEKRGLSEDNGTFRCRHCSKERVLIVAKRQSSPHK